MSSILRTVLSVLAGYLLIAALLNASGTVVQALNGTNDTVAFVSLLLSLPCAILGGYVAARIAREQAMAATIALSILAVVVGVLAFWLGQSRQPMWYRVGLLLLLAAGAYRGGSLRRQQTLKLVR